MSWDKNTYNLSHIDESIDILSKYGAKYKLTVLGRVVAMGMNDTFEDRSEYVIRRLDYKDQVMLERMERTEDCDSDDIIMSYEIDLKYIPKKWRIEKTTDDRGKIYYDKRIKPVILKRKGI